MISTNCRKITDKSYKMKKILLYSLLITLLMACGNKNKQAEPVATAETERPEWVYDAVLYEVNTRQFSRRTFSTFADELPPR